MTTSVDRFNKAYPVGALVRYWPGARTGPGRIAATRTPAWLMSGRDTVVSVLGYAGGISLTHVEPVTTHIRFAETDHWPTLWWAECHECPDFHGPRHDSFAEALAEGKAHHSEAHYEAGHITVECEGSDACPTDTHVHGCYADHGSCDQPREHRPA